MNRQCVVALAFFAAGVVPTTHASAQSSFAALSAKDRLAFMKQEANDYQFFLDADEEKELVPAKSLHRFDDPISGVVDGALLFWLHDGRPAATMSIWHRRDGLTAHEFQSLSEMKVLAKAKDQIVWRPLGGGVQPNLLVGVSDPADSAADRLTQMQTAIRRFSAATSVRSTRRELQLLPSPVYRYGEKGSPILDGAWFMFAKGTNPEVMVALEAYLDKDGAPGWRFIPARMTSAGCELKCDGAIVWTVPYTRGKTPVATYFNIYSRE